LTICSDHLLGYGKDQSKSEFGELAFAPGACRTGIPSLVAVFTSMRSSPADSVPNNLRLLLSHCESLRPSCSVPILGTSVNRNRQRGIAQRPSPFDSKHARLSGE
jgi:hypothetical protein